MRAVLLIEEMPTECIECQFCRVLADDKITETRCILTAKRNEDGVNTRAEWCPLRPLPQKLKLRIQREWITDYDRYEIGYNACLDKIAGEAE